MISLLFIVISLLMAATIVYLWLRFKKQILIIAIFGFLTYCIYKFIFRG